MNRRRQIQLSPDEQAAFLREHRKAALATIGKDGFPHVVAMNFLAKDGAFYMTSYGKAQKVLNIRRNPKVALMAETGDNYAELRGVMIRGECEIIEGADAVRECLRRNGRSARRPARRTAARIGRQRAKARRAENSPGEDHQLGSPQARRRLLDWPAAVVSLRAIAKQSRAAKTRWVGIASSCEALLAMTLRPS